MYVHRPTRLFQNYHVTFTSLTLLSANTVIFCLRNVHNTLEQLQYGSMPNVMTACPNIGGALSESSVIPFLVPRRKVWLTTAAGVPCSNAANTGERKTWTFSEYCTGQNSARGSRATEKCIYTLSQKTSHVLYNLL